MKDTVLLLNLKLSFSLEAHTLKSHPRNIVCCADVNVADHNVFLHNVEEKDPLMYA